MDEFITLCVGATVGFWLGVGANSALTGVDAADYLKAEARCNDAQSRVLWIQPNGDFSCINGLEGEL